jgi:hypothetical protein
VPAPTQRLDQLGVLLLQLRDAILVLQRLRTQAVAE